MPALRSINQDDLRNHNLSVVLDTLLRADEPMSRADLAKATGLTKATMSLLVSLLLDNGILQEGEPAAQSTYGRPSTPLQIRAGAICSLGLQVNTDGYGVCVVDLNGAVVAERWIEANMTNADAPYVFHELNMLAQECEHEALAHNMRLVGAALALPGLVTGNMQLLMARNLGWERLDLTSFDVVRRLDACAGNEANMAALAQIPGYATRRQGKGIVEPTDSFIYLSTDVGIGGAVVQRGAVLSGEHGFGGELGHVSVDMRGPVCRCGRRGCLEVYAGRRAMVESAGIASGSAAATRDALNELLSRWHHGDAKALAVVDHAIEAMVSVMASTINAFDVDTVILGGLWARMEPEFAQRMEHMVRPQVLGYPRTQARVLISQVTARPALLGASYMGMRRFLDDPLRFLAQN